MTIYMLNGDILYSGVVEVEAASVQDAIDKADRGEFKVFDTNDSNLGFVLDGPILDENGNEIEDVWKPVPATQQAPSEEPRKYAGVEWTANDVAERLGISEPDAEAWLQDHGNALRDRLIEIGWEVIDALAE